jgi:hypothetical protein
MMKLVDLSIDTIKCALVTNAYTPNEDHNLWSDVSDNEASGVSYTAGGATLAGKTVVQDDDNNRGVFDANDVIWTTSTITARYAVLYDITVDNNLICLIDFGSNQSSDAKDFAIIWHADGIIVLALKVVC